MPQGQEHLSSGDRHRDEAVELILRPALREERRGQDDDPEAALGDAVVDLPPEDVADFELELVVPDIEAVAAQGFGQRADDVDLVLAGVRERLAVRRDVSGPARPRTM